MFVKSLFFIVKVGFFLQLLFLITFFIDIKPIINPVRGGTDGARLSFMGLPCPNLGTGGYGFHGPFEHISVEGMETAVNIIKSIVKHVLMLADA